MLKDNLKTLRHMTGLSQRRLADELGVSVKTVSHWESGYSEPSLAMLSRLRRVLDVEYEDLLE
ncbi:MAG: helix-turn-helix transcriptional regulator [Christensenellales bacterium]